MLRVDAAKVSGVKFFSSLNTTGNRSPFSELGFHLISTNNRVVLADVVFLVRNGTAVLETIIASSRCRGCAISAQIEVSALTTLKVESSVLLARAIRNTMIEGILVNLGRITTVAATTSLAVDNSLSIQTDGSGVLESIHDVESISDSTGGALSPT